MNGPELRTPQSRRRTFLLAFGALGVVYGDVGTNVLFALRAAFTGPHSFPATAQNVLGVLSLVFWALVFVLGLKYLVLIMRADNRGEGGILALLALLAPRGRPPSRRKAILVSVGLFGAALVYGDGVITPAISVLAAVEGLALAESALGRAVVPATIGILIVLFLAQPRGTGRIGLVFGPIMLVWFITIATLGIGAILRHPQVLVAMNPLHAVRFLVEHGPGGFLVLGAVVLTVAGAEALYADMGHFGATPIRLAWYGIVFPALLLNYFGQGAALLDAPGAVWNPFYALVPTWVRYPMVGLATAATIIASQALISGAFSLTRQAIQLGYLPLVTVKHTSPAVRGQVFIPEVNAALMVACIALVLTFRESSRLAAAYGMAVAGAMATTSLLFFFVTREQWGWGILRAGTLVLAFLVVDLAFLGANLVKIPHGAWIPLVVAGAVYTLMATWRRGVESMRQSLTSLPVDTLLREIEETRPVRVPGVAVFVTRQPETVPPELMHYLRRSHALHERVVLLTVQGVEVPRVDDDARVEVRALPGGVLQMTARFGFMESPDVPTALGLTETWSAFAHDEVTFFIGEATPVRTARPGMARWRKALFSFLWLVSRSAQFHLRLPAGQVVEVGMEVEI